MTDAESSSRACIRYGWTALAVFLLLGLFLEAMHLFKTPFYLEVRLRRELWTLAHAHGTLLAVVTLVFGLAGAPLVGAAAAVRASWAIRIGAVLVPAGFFLGGIGNSEPDPSLAIMLVPAGALMVLYAVLVAARAAWSDR